MIARLSRVCLCVCVCVAFAKLLKERETSSWTISLTIRLTIRLTILHKRCLQAFGGSDFGRFLLLSFCFPLAFLLLSSTVQRNPQTVCSFCVYFRIGRRASGRWLTRLQTEQCKQ